MLLTTVNNSSGQRLPIYFRTDFICTLTWVLCRLLVGEAGYMKEGWLYKFLFPFVCLKEPS